MVCFHLHTLRYRKHINTSDLYHSISLTYWSLKSAEALRLFKLGKHCYNSLSSSIGQEEPSERLSHLENVIYLAQFQIKAKTILLPCKFYFFVLNTSFKLMKFNIFAVKEQHFLLHADIRLGMQIFALVGEHWYVYLCVCRACKWCVKHALAAAMKHLAYPHCLANRAWQVCFMQVQKRKTL